MRVFVLLLVLALAASWAGGEEEFDGVIRMGGSSTLLPVMADCANTFMEKYHTWDKVDPALPKKQILIYVTGGGSGFGIKAAASGIVHIGLSTRKLKDEEKTAIGEHETFLVGKDCLSAVTHKDSPLATSRANVTRAEAAKLLTGEAKTWKELDPALADKPVVILIRDMAGSANELIQKDILKNKTFSPGALQLPSMGAILKKSEENANSFAFLSSGMANASDKLKIFSFEDVLPSNENVLSGKYPLARPMLLLVKGRPSAPHKAFIDFVLGDGQKTVESHGYIPAKAAGQK